MYIIYIKQGGSKRFLPYNGEGFLVKNLIHAMLYTKENAEQVASNLREDNPGMNIEIRKKK